MDEKCDEMDRAEEQFAEELEKENQGTEMETEEEMMKMTVGEEVQRADEMSLMNFLHKGRISGKRVIRPSKNIPSPVMLAEHDDSLFSDYYLPVEHHGKKGNVISRGGQIMPNKEDDVGVNDNIEIENDNIAGDNNNTNTNIDSVLTENSDYSNDDIEVINNNENTNDDIAVNNDNDENIDIKIDPVSLSRSVRHYLTYNQIRWERFADLVLGVSQSRLSTLLSKPRSWHLLSRRVQALYERMQLWMDTRATYGNNPYLQEKTGKPNSQVNVIGKKGKQKKKPRSLLDMEENVKLFESVKKIEATEAHEMVDDPQPSKINNTLENHVIEEADAFSYSRKNWCDVCSYALPESQTVAEHVLMRHITNIEGLCDVCGADAITSEDFVKHFTTHMKKPDVDAVPEATVAGMIIMNEESLLVENIKEESTEQNVENEDSLCGNGQLALNPFYGENI